MLAGARPSTAIQVGLLLITPLLQVPSAMRTDADEDIRMLEAESSNGSEAGAYPSVSIQEAAQRTQLHACVRSRVEEFHDAYSYLGLQAPALAPGARGLTMKELLMVIFNVEDEIDRHERHLKKCNKFMACIKRYRSSTRAELEERLEDLVEKLSLSGFNYKTANERCKGKKSLFSNKASLTDRVYKCMQIKVHNASIDGSIASEADVQLQLLKRIMTEELLAHEKRKDVKKKLRSIREEARSAIKDSDFSFSTAQKECDKSAGKEAVDEELGKRALEELDVADVIDNVCQEEEGEMCPEGTAPDTQRKLDVIRGSKAATTATISAQAMYIVGFGLAGLITGGPPGLLAGIGAGIAMPATPFGAAAWFWFSIGPNTCACFLRDCEFDHSTGVCGVSPGSSAASTNPFGRALPYPGTKCGLKWKQTDECERLSCTTADYAHQSENPGAPFGRVGTYDGDPTLYNCLSGTGHPEHSFSVLKALPSGKNNTVAHRNELFGELGIKEKLDKPVTAPEDSE